MQHSKDSELTGVVHALLHEIAGIDPMLLNDDATIDGDLEMNSVTFVELQVALEEELDVIIDPIIVVELNRLGDIIDHLERLVAEKMK